MHFIIISKLCVCDFSFERHRANTFLCYLSAFHVVLLYHLPKIVVKTFRTPKGALKKIRAKISE